MLFISPDLLLIMSTKIKNNHKTTFPELQKLVTIIKKNLESTKIKVIVPIYPSLSNGNTSWQKHFYVLNETYHPFNTGEETEKYNQYHIEKFTKDLINQGLSPQEADDIIFNILSDFKTIINTKNKTKKLSKTKKINEN